MHQKLDRSERNLAELAAVAEREREELTAQLELEKVRLRGWYALVLSGKYSGINSVLNSTRQVVCGGIWQPTKAP